MASLPAGWTWDTVKTVLEQLKPLGVIASADIDGADTEATGAVGLGGPPTAVELKIKADAGGHPYELRQGITNNACTLTIDGNAADKADLALKEGVVWGILTVKPWVKYIMLWTDASGARHQAAFRAETEMKLQDYLQLPIHF